MLYLFIIYLCVFLLFLIHFSNFNNLPWKQIKMQNNKVYLYSWHKYSESYIACFTGMSRKQYSLHHSAKQTAKSHMSLTYHEANTREKQGPLFPYQQNIHVNK